MIAMMKQTIQIALGIIQMINEYIFIQLVDKNVTLNNPDKFKKKHIIKWGEDSYSFEP